MPKGLKKFRKEDILRMRWLVEYKGFTPSEVKDEYRIPSTKVDDVFLYKVLPSLRPTWDSFDE